MANSFIQVPTDGAGKTVDTRTTAGDGDHRQVIVLGHESTDAGLVDVVTGAPVAGTAYALFVRNAPRREGQTLSTTPLGISGSFTQTAQDGNEDGVVFVSAVAESDQNGATDGFLIEEYDGDDDDFSDASHVRSVAIKTYTASSTLYLYGIVRGRKWRVRYTNGGTGQTTFKLTASASPCVLPVAVADMDTGSGQQEVPLHGIALPASGGAVAGGTATNPVRTDPTGSTTQPVSGTVTASAQPGVDIGDVTINNAGGASAVNVQDGGNVISVDDGAGSLTVDAPVATPVHTRLSDGTDVIQVTAAGELNVIATAQPGVDVGDVTINNAAGGSAVNVQDGGNSLTVDAPVATPAHVRLSDGTDVTNVTAAGELNVLATAQPGTDIGDVTINNAAGASAVNIQDGGNTITVDGTVTAAQATAANLNAQVVGNVANDAADSGNPVKVGGKANLNEPTAVGDADRVDAWMDRHGRLVVLGGHANPETPVNVTATASGDTAVIAAPGAGVSLHICKGSVHNSGSTPIQVALQANGSATDVWAAELASDGGGSLFDFGSRGWKLAANTGLDVNLGAAGTVEVNITEYYIAP